MSDTAFRRELAAVLDGRGAHMDLDEAVADFPEDAMNRRPPNVSYTAWQLLEHIRLTQSDILDYVTNPGYRERAWPEEYWPPGDSVATPEQFAAALEGFRSDQAALRKLVLDPAVDPLAPIPNTPGHSLFREVRIVADHNAYHIGEFAILRQVMGTWPAERAG